MWGCTKCDVLFSCTSRMQVNIPDYEAFDVVQILDDKEKALKLQQEFGILWLEEMNDVRTV